MLQMRAQRAKSTAKGRFVCCAFGLSAAVMSVLVFGCATHREDLVKSGRVTLQKHRSGKVHIAWCDVYRDENGPLVTGVLRRWDTVGMPIKVRVNVEVIAPDGRTVEEGCSSAVFVPRRMIGGSKSLKRFTVRLLKMPPCGSQIHLVTVSSAS